MPFIPISQFKNIAIYYIFLWLSLKSIGVQAELTVELPKKLFGAANIAIIVNDADELSKQVGQYYQQQRQIPRVNLIHVNFKPGLSSMSVAEFKRIKLHVDNKASSSIQAYVLTWLKPYRVTCMSITSAFAFGFDRAFCAQSCLKTKPSPYFNSTSHLPYTDYGIRPSMVLAGENFSAVKKLIQRGIAADNSAPKGTAYLMDTNDKNRNVRAIFYDDAIKLTKNSIKVYRVKAQSLRNKQDVLFYFTGLVRVPHIKTNRFVAGAVADHLTSTGGQLTDSKQMSIMRWIDAGATGSYGAVVEPCNWPQKFPHPSIVMSRYTYGETLIEAYWKSVNMPGQGIFVGEPLARPFGGYRIINYKGKKNIRVWSLDPGRYALLGSHVRKGPYQEISQFTVKQPGVKNIPIKGVNYSFLKIQRKFL